MERTLKMLKQISTKENEERSLEELSELYKVDKNPMYFASAFVILYNLIWNIVYSFLYGSYVLNEDDVTSFTLEILDNVLFKFEPDKNNKFITFFVTCLKNKCLTERTKKMAVKQKPNTYILEDGLDSLLGKGVEDKYNFGYNITKLENEFCGLIAINYGNLNQIANKLGISECKARKIKNSLKNNRRFYEEIKYNII